VDETRPIIVGEIVSAHGIKGWVKIHSHTQPPASILQYQPWTLNGKGIDREWKLLAGRAQGRTVVAHLEGIDDRDQALALKSCQISVPRSCFPALEAGHYYWFDLVGLDIFNTEGAALGKLSGMMETGANDVIIAQGERERLIPFVMGEYVKEVDLEKKVLIVAWDPDF
jgi:16S rRNA processing protein RimM